MNLALHCIANVGSREMAESFASEIPSILVAGCVQCVNIQTLTSTLGMNLLIAQKTFLIKNVHVR